MGENVKEVKTFHMVEDFRVKVGPKGAPVTIPRLSFKNSQKVINIISGLMAEDSSYALKAAGKAQEAAILLREKSFNNYADFVKKSIPFLNELSNYGVVVELLTELSCGVLTEKLAKEYDMQYGEVVDLVAYLLDENFASRKNLSASLEAIAVSVKSPSK